MDLTIVLESGQRKRFPITGERITLGRRDDCDIHIDSQSVSRIHAELVRVEEDAWELRDLGSLNGIEVEGESVLRWTLAEGDDILLGDVHLLVGSVAANDSTVISKRERKPTGLWLDADHRLLRFGERQLGERLAPREYSLLKLLADAGGHVVERKALEEALWGANAYDDNALHQLVRRTRDKIHDDAAEPRILLTLPGVGYRLDLTARIAEA